MPATGRYGPSRGNYGGLPQTWSNSNISDAVTGFPGDNDPLDVLDISSIRAPIGGIYRVKVSPKGLVCPKQCFMYS
jgi:inorganic pyrophosphatase